MRNTRGIFAGTLCLVLAGAGTAAAGPVLDRIQKSGELVVGISGEQPPLSATTREGRIVGLEADVASRLAADMGVTLKLAKIPFADLLPALSAGKVDLVLSGMTMTAKRNRAVAFAGPYYVTGKAFLTKQKTIASLRSADGVNAPEYTVATLKDSTSQRFVEEVLPRAKLVKTASYAEAIDLVLGDKAHVMVADHHFCAVAAYRHRGKGLATVEAPFTFDPIGVAVPDGDPLLLNLVQNFLSSLAGSGDLKTMTEKWFGNPSWLDDLP